MSDILCSKCNETKPGLTEAPFPNEMGQAVLAKTCEDCWQAWVGQQLMLMNEYRLDPMDDEHSSFLDREMIKFLCLH